MTQTRLILDYVYEHEVERASQVFLTQPTGAGKTVDYTWADTMDQSRRMAAHLISLELGTGARIAILAKNSAHFMMAELAIWMAGGTTVAIFPTESAATIDYVLKHSGASLLFIGKLDSWAQQASAVPAGLPCIALPLAPDVAPNLAPNADLQSWDAIVARVAPVSENISRGADELAMLMYTSGSTGQPKGVMHSFERVTRASECIVNYQTEELGLDFDYRALSYLPLAHVFERAWIECTGFVLGRSHIYFAESLETFVADLQRARPTVFISVPRLWLKFQQGVFGKMPAKKLDRLLSIPILGKIVGRKVLKGLGLDQVVQAGSGSAPIPAALIDWYRRLGLNLMEGYGMTEDFAVSNTSTKKFSMAGHVGVPLPGVKVRIDADGEVLIKSPGQMIGYYKNPELNAESFTEDGYFRTGDLGQLRADGQLKLTGRKKELFKTAKGKYVAPAPIENRINEHPMVEMSLVSGVGQQAAYAMIVLSETLRPKVKDPEVRAHIEAEFTALLKAVNQGLSDYEKIRMIVLMPEPWSIDNGCLTPTMKIKRSKAETGVAEKVDSWYLQPGPIIWA
jgi:long-subunit acyl-CoA synthetase (AMP-forming)